MLWLLALIVRRPPPSQKPGGGHAGLWVIALHSAQLPGEALHVTLPVQLPDRHVANDRPETAQWAAIPSLDDVLAQIRTHGSCESLSKILTTTGNLPKTTKYGGFQREKLDPNALHRINGTFEALLAWLLFQKNNLALATNQVCHLPIPRF